MTKVASSVVNLLFAMPGIFAMQSLAFGQSETGLRAEIATNLQRHILNPWFPSAVDHKLGGFLEDFDNSWQPVGQQENRSIVYQSRLTWVAARAMKYDPTRAKQYGDWAIHGLSQLEMKMWDSVNGGFFWQIDAESGNPSDAHKGEKHVYGNSFGIYASATVYETTGEKRALELAKRAFLWLENHAHDGLHGGYKEALDRSGKPVISNNPADKDSIGTRYGFKSMNTHIHLLEAFSQLHHVWPDALVTKRLNEVFHIVRDKVYTNPGALHLYFNPDWSPVPDGDSFGHDIETAYLLVEASEELGLKHDSATWKAAQNLVDHALQVGWDEQNGGFYDYGTTFGPATKREKIWWTQAEGLNALLLMDREFGKITPKYADAFAKQWRFISKYQVDSTNGGWYTSVSESGKPDGGQRKSDMWKDPYHQGRALMNILEMLRKG